MKNILQLVINLYYWFCCSLFSFFGILWYGKLPKVSFYHWAVNGCLFTTKGIYNDVNHQVYNTKCVPSKVKGQIIEDYINALRGNEVFKANVNDVDIPIFDGKEIIGNQSLYHLLERIKSNHLKSVS